MANPARRTRAAGALAGALALAGCVLAACEEPPKKNPFDPPPGQPKQPPPSEPPQPKGPPELAIDGLGPKIGFTRVLLDKPEGRARLTQELGAVREHFEGKDATAIVDRKAKIPWVVALVDDLAKIGVSKVTIKTETRKEYPAEIGFTPVGKLSSPAACSVVAMVLDDRGTAVWKLDGGTATKRAKGFAGPDLTMTGDTIVRIAKGCKQSDVMFVSATDVIEWGLLYDLAASARTLSEVSLGTLVLLREPPVPGHKVDLGA